MKIKRKPNRATNRTYLLNKFGWLFLHSRKTRIAVWQWVLTPRSDHGCDYCPADSDRLCTHLVKSRPAHRIAGALVVMLIIVAAQMAYPADRALPLSRLDGYGFVGGATKDKIATKFQDFDTRIVTIHTNTKQVTTSYQGLGVRPNTDETFRELSAYSLKERLVPFSIITKGIVAQSVSRDLNEAQLKLFSRDIIAETSKKPVDANVKQEGTKLLLIQGEEGYEYQADTLRSMVMKITLQDKANLVYTPTIIEPAITNKVAREAALRMQNRINQPFKINAESKHVVIDTQTIASWVDIAPRPEKRTIDITFNKDRVANSLRDFAARVDEAPTPTKVTLLNGFEAGSNKGSNQKVLQFDELVGKVLENAAYPLVVNVEASVKTLPPPTVYERHYTRNSLGVQNLLNYWTQQHRAYYSIDFQTTDGKIRAGINPSRNFPANDLQQMYLASLIYGRITGKSLSGGSWTSMGWNVDSCMYEMVQAGHDGCSNALGEIIGWGAGDQMLHAQGLLSTSLRRGGGVTNAQDTSRWLLKLMEGSLVTKSQSNGLTEAMKSQVPRTGIPAGSLGIAVANKSSAYRGSVHDVGIVYHPRGTYVLSVLSEGGSFQEIADLTSEINKVLYE